MLKKILSTLLTIIFIITILILVKNNIFLEKHNRHKETVDYDQAAKYAYFPIADSGTSTGLVYKDKNRIIDQRYFKFNQSNFNSTIAISNQNSQKKNYLLLFLVNFEQRNVIINGEKMSKFKLSLDSKEAAFVPFRIDGLDDGLNELSFILIPDPDTQNLEEKYRFSTDLSHVITQRINIVVNKLYTPKISFNKYNSIKNLPSLDGALVSKSNELVPWLSENTHGESNIHYKIHVGNNTSKNKHFALIIFLNWEQITINNSIVEYGKVPPNSIVTIDSKIGNVNKLMRGVSNFTVLYIPEPYRNIEESDFDSQILPTTRVGIEKIGFWCKNKKE